MMTSRKQQLFPWLLVFYEMIIYLSMDFYVPALPNIAHTFHTTAQMAQYTAIVWMVGGLIMQPVFGPLSDRFGRKPLIVYGGILFIVSSVACALALNIQMLLWARFLQGIAMPTMFIAGYAAINEFYESKTAIAILARMNSMTILAPAFGPMVGGAFLLYLDWRWIFLVLAVAALIAVSLLCFYMPETLVLEKRSTHFKLKQIRRQYSLVLLNKKFMLYALITFLPIIGLIAWMMVGPFVVVNMFHYSTFDFGVIQLFVFASFILGTKLVTWFNHEARHQRLINIGLFCAVLGSILLSVITFYFTHLLLLPVIALMITTLGSGMMIPVLSRLTLDASQAPMGIKVTVFSIIRIASGIIGSICITLFYSGSLFSMAMIMLIFTLLALVLRLLPIKNSANVI